MSDDERIDVSGLIKSGWKYMDWPRMEPCLWDAMIEAMGHEHHHLLSLAIYHESDRDSPITAKRGQMIISPTGIERLSAWNVARKVAASNAGARP